MLLTIILLPLITALILYLIPSHCATLLKRTGLCCSLLTFIFSIIILSIYDTTKNQFQLCQTISWATFSSSSFTLGLDGLSLLLILLTAFLIPICCLLSWNYTVEKNIKNYNISLMLLESILFVIFSSLNLVVFYVAFEAVLIPMYYIIGFYGSKNRKVRASYMIFLYTLVSSLFMFLSIIYFSCFYGTTDYLLLKETRLDPMVEKLCWLAFFFSFAVKMPLLPFHIWLPEAHCEAPTAGSVILAGILLKLGGFGFLRYSIGLFPEPSAYFTPFIYTISSFGVIYASMSTLQQVDLKKIIAYSSIGHMSLVTIGIFSNNSQGILGAILLMVSHGIVSSALFLCIGILYERHNTRIIKYFSGLINTMPVFSICFVIFTLGNIGLPGTSSFIGEFLVIIGCFETNSWVGVLCSTGMVFSVGYSLWLLNRILLGNAKTIFIKFSRDLTRIEFNILLPFILLTFLLGIFPDVLSSYVSVL